MASGINNFKDGAELISYIITSLSLIGIWVTYSLSKKQIHFSVIEKCLNDFHAFAQLEDKSNIASVKAYLELVNEELFYIEKGYLPLDITIEWIDGMIDFLPFNNNDEFVKSRNLNHFENSEITVLTLNFYPRIIKTIQLSDTIDFTKIHLAPNSPENRKLQFQERSKLINQMISNLNIVWWKKIRLQKLIRNR